MIFGELDGEHGEDRSSGLPLALASELLCCLASRSGLQMGNLTLQGVSACCSHAVSWALMELVGVPGCMLSSAASAVEAAWLLSHARSGRDSLAKP